MDDAAVIRADAQLTTAGKQERIAELQDEANRQLQQFREDYVAAGSAAVAESTKRAFSHSSSSDVLLLRDAALRAQQLDSEGEASVLLSTALRQGDVALAKEITLRAIDQRWAKAVSQYSDANPSYAGDVKAAWDAAAPSSWRDGFSNAAMAFSELTLRA
jgi:hypothetical protein